MNRLDTEQDKARPAADFDDIESRFNENVGTFMAQIRHMNQLKIPDVMGLLSVSKKTYMEMEKGKRRYRMHLVAWWCFVMGMSPLHILAQSDYFAHLPVGDYRNIRQIKLALLLQRLPQDKALRLLQGLVDDCPRLIHRDAEASFCIEPEELAQVRPFFFSRDYYHMIGDGIRRYLSDTGMTRREFARYLNVTSRTIRRILNAEVDLNYSYYARFYLTTGLYPLKMVQDSPYLKIRLKLEQRLFLINEIIAGYGSEPDRLDEYLIEAAREPVEDQWRALFRRLPRSRKAQS